MSESPVPLPPGRAPDGVPSWISSEAGRWTRERPPRWTRPLWSILALSAALCWTVAAEPPGPCHDYAHGPYAPCGPDWLDTARLGLLLGQFLWYFLLPELTLLSVPALAALVAWQQVRPDGDASRPASLAALAVVAALALGWAAALRRLVARRRQRRLVERLCADARHPLPETAPDRMRRGARSLRAGLVLCAVAAAATGAGLTVAAEREEAAPAVPDLTTGAHAPLPVPEFGDGYHPFPAGGFETAPRDVAVIVVAEGEAEDDLFAGVFGSFGLQLSALAAGVPGATLVAAGALARRRAAVPDGARVPALRVLQRTDLHGDTWIHPADDAAGLTPLFSCTAVPADGDAGQEEGEEGETRKNEEPTDTRLREAVLHGVPHEGGELLLLTTGPDGAPLVARTGSPVRPASEGDEPVLLPDPDPDPGPAPAPDPGHVPAPGPDADGRTPESPTGPAEHAESGTAPADRGAGPVRWGPGGLTRCAALLPLAGSGFLTTALCEDPAAESPGRQLLGILLLPVLITVAAALLGRRVTADRSGLWLTGAWRVRHLPWEQLRAVTRADGGLRILRTDGTRWVLRLFVLPRSGSRPGRQPPYVRAAGQINAMRARPRLRPTEESRPHEHGMPLGPLLCVPHVLWAAALLLL
ncbi:hypothetical protein GQS52_15000 [Streptomyces sp. SCUT-3]|uniref:hypothetical protein n=1 Tax=Streptomyces sp. SCUT-3 TaxID=2684469 RepID=UPI0015F8D807|nr:hypothetical protein [Streptomyces sp. SCUT-3]QMV22866.1 hypothetical protein GQS52_15000 [Streptomyces sp. SCUT-3]